MGYVKCTSWTVIFMFFPVVNSLTPWFDGLPTTVNVGELEYQDRLIYNITVNDVSDVNSFICNINDETLNRTDKFRVLKDPDTNHYGVYTHNLNPGTASAPNYLFNAATQLFYDLFIQCDDQAGSITSAKLQVDVIVGDSVEFTSIPSSLTVDAKNTKSGDLLYDINARDAKFHNLEYRIVTDPLNGSSSFTIDRTSGKLLAARDLDQETVQNFKIYVFVSDGKIEVRETIGATLYNMNRAPVIQNLPASIGVQEDIAAGDVIFTLSTRDLDTSDTLTYSMTINPVSSDNLFVLDTSTKEIKLNTGKTLNYEQTNKVYNLTLYVSDGRLSTGPYSLIVNVQNVNEPCYFGKTLYWVTMEEGAAFTTSRNPGFVVNDYDGVSTYTLSLQNANNSDKFALDSTTGVISYASNYDVDLGAMASTNYLTVVCTDPTGLTGTAQLIVYITDVNDNAPVFSQQSYSFVVSQNTAIGLIGSVTATDRDSGTNGEFTCSTVSSDVYFTIGFDCGIYLSSVSGLTADQVIRYTVLAVDKGSPAMTGTTYVTVRYVPVTTTTTTTTTTSSTTTTTQNPLSNSGTVAAIVLSSIFGAILLGLGIYFLWRCCYTGLCCGPEKCDFMDCCGDRSSRASHPRRQVTPQGSPPRSPKREKPERPKERYREKPRETAEEFKYRRDDNEESVISSSPRVIIAESPRHHPDTPPWLSARAREDTDLGSVRNGKDLSRYSGQHYGGRDYLDYPKALTPADVPMEVTTPQSGRLIGYRPYHSGY